VTYYCVCVMLSCPPSVIYYGACLVLRDTNVNNYHVGLNGFLWHEFLHFISISFYIIIDPHPYDCSMVIVNGVRGIPWYVIVAPRVTNNWLQPIKTLALQDWRNTRTQNNNKYLLLKIPLNFINIKHFGICSDSVIRYKLLVLTLIFINTLAVIK